MADAPTCNALATPAKDAGNSSFAAGRYQEAYDYYSQAILADPDSALLRSNRSGTLAALGRYVEALADADKCCQLRPDWYKSHVRRGHAMFQLNRVTDAEACYQEALHLNPEDKTVEEALERCLQRKRGGNSGGTSAGAPAGPQGGGVPPGGVVANPGGMQPMPGMQSMPGMQMQQMPGMQQPMMGMQQPMMGMQQPMMGMQQPMMGMQQPMMGMQQPMMGMQQPMMGMQQPMMGMQQPMMGMQQPAGAMVGQQPMPAMQNPAAANQDLRGAASGFPAGAGALPTEFHKLTEKEMRQRLEESVAKLSDEQLDEELKGAGIKLPASATRAEKVQKYLHIDEPIAPVVEKKKQPVMARFGDGIGDTTRGDRLMEKRKKWVEEWSTWDEERLLHRLLKLGIDASGNPKARLIDLLLEAETERFNKQRCTPKRLQFIGLACAGATVLGSFAVVGTLFAIGI